jgi:hypothetical protein
MMGWMAPLRHLGCQNAGWAKTTGEQGAHRVGLLPKAGHMTASDLYFARHIISCQAGGRGRYRDHCQWDFLIDLSCFE